MNKILFYDTNVLLDKQKEVFETENKFYISSITLNELEDIKTSGKKDEEVRYSARTILNLLDENEDKYEVVLYKNSYFDEIAEHDFEKTPDAKIIACAYHMKNAGDDILFVTQDKTCREIAAALGLEVLRPQRKEDEYLGFKEVDLDEQGLADFYDGFPRKNRYELLENQYLIVKLNGTPVGRYIWRDCKLEEVRPLKFESKMFGKTVPLKGDIYQQFAMDSLYNNKFTIIQGPAGSGKDYLGLGYGFQLLEKGKIDKIIIVCNTVAVRGAAKLGFYPGSKDEKVLDSQIGNFLVGKLGDIEIVYQLIQKGMLMLVPASDIRGFDTSGMNALYYCTEAQNMTIDMMKLILQRVGDDSIVIFNGDSNAQVDLQDYAGKNNGLRRAVEVFKGEPYFGTVALQNIYRSDIAKKAEEM